MKFLAVHPGPHFSVADVFVGWTEALRDLGCQVSRFNFDDRLTFFGNALMETDREGVFRRACASNQQVTELALDGLYRALYRFRPDVLLVVSGFFIPHDLYDLARAYGTKVVLVHTESPYEDLRQLKAAEHADLNLINDPTNIDQFRAVSWAEYMPHAYRPSLHHPGEAKPELVCDFGFVGTGYPSRIDFLEAMDLGGLDVLLGGNWQALEEDSPLRKYVGHDLELCMDNSEAASLYRSARSSINLYRREAECPELSAGWACGPREIELAASGCFYLRDPRPEGDELFPMLPTFTTPGEASALLRWWLDHPALREDAAEAARVAVQDRTFDAHARRLMRLLG